jgi:hypothetical protein
MKQRADEARLIGIWSAEDGVGEAGRLRGAVEWRYGTD